MLEVILIALSHQEYEHFTGNPGLHTLTAQQQLHKLTMLSSFPTKTELGHVVEGEVADSLGIMGWDAFKGVTIFE